MKTLYVSLLILTTSLCAKAQNSPQGKVLEVSKPAQTAQGLKMKSSQVPTIDLSKLKRLKDGTTIIPRGNIGEEAAFKANDYTMTLPQLPVLSLPSPTKTISTINFDVKKEVLAPFKALDKINVNQAAQLPPVPLKDVADPQLKESIVEPIKITEFKTNDEKLLQALIFYEIKKKSVLALGLFVDLFSDAKFELEARYYYGLIAHELQLYSEFRSELVKVAKAKSGDKNLRAAALQKLVDLSTGLEVNDVLTVENLKNDLKIDIKTNPNYSLLKAKYFSEKGDLTEVDIALLGISEKDNEYIEAQLIKALLLYRTAQVTESQTLLEILTNDKRLSDKYMLGLANMTLARIQFQKGLYKEAWHNYLKVSKDHPLWLEAIQEQSLSQILAKDFEGAAGNLFSLHTDFFKNAYAPETYTLRSVSYVNLCQFGDGLQVMNQFKRKYENVKASLDKLYQEKKNKIDFYEAIKLWTRNPDLKSIEGIPRPFLIEMARHPSFLNFQKRINRYEDERERFNKVTVDMIRLEREGIVKLSELKENLAKAKKDNVTARIGDLEKEISQTDLELKIYKSAKEQVKKVRQVSEERISKEKDQLKLEAMATLNQRFQKLLTQLGSLIEQGDALTYEIYAGAGEHLRFQMAGGEVSKDKTRPELKVTKEQALTWKFKGEIWEDEVGHYRSSLKNVCPDQETAQK